MITVTMPEWLVWFIVGWLILVAFAQGLEAYLSHLKMKLERLRHIERGDH